VSPKAILRDSKTAWDAAENYQRDSRELFRLKAQISSGYTTTSVSEVEREIVRLESAIASNPVKGMIDGGLMPSIVEDLSTEEEIYSYNSLFVRSTKKFTDKVNPKLREFAKGAYMSHETKVYKTLSHITQLSNFVARQCTSFVL
jgi:hypothetical protein